MVLTEEMIKNLPLKTEEELKEIMLPTDELVEIAIKDFDEQLKIDEPNDTSCILIQNHNVIVKDM